MKCKECGVEAKHFAKGLCKKCYSRKQRDRLYANNPEPYKKRQIEYYRNNKDKIAKYKIANKLKLLEYRREYDRRTRLEILDLLGGKCVKCGFSDWRGLQLDHINGGGCKEQKIFGRPKSMYLYYLKNIDEAKVKLQVLCANCNQIKKYENKECYKQ